jgi:Domain of unknown function (DUF4214)
MRFYAFSRFTRKLKRVFLARAVVVIMALLGSAVAAHATTYNVSPGESLQPYIDIAQYGDSIQLQAGATYVGPFTLRYKTYSEPYRLDYITIVTAGAYSNLQRGNRVSPGQAVYMAKIVTPGGNEPAIKTEPGAHHYRFVGVEFTLQSASAVVNDLITLGSGNSSDQSTLSQVPHHFEIDRCYIHGLPGVPLKRGVELNSAFTDIMNSYISECHVQGQDTQAIGGWNGPGPYTIANNYLEAAGENVMFGGAIATIPNLVPSDIQIRNNYFFKPPSWRPGEPGFSPMPPPMPGAPDHWTVKNLFELKNARTVMAEGNLFENSWVDAQDGYALLFTVRAEGGMMPWATVDNVQFSNNIVRHAGLGIDVLGHECDNAANCPAAAKHLTISNNLFDDINGPRWGGGDGAGKFLVILNGADSVTLDHNTVFQTSNIVTAGGSPDSSFVLTNNIAPHNDYGIAGDGQQPGNNSINTYLPGSVIRRNIIPGASFPYPADNFYPSSLDDVGFVNRWSGDYHDYHLASNSPFKNVGTDGKDPGFDVDALDRELNGNPIDNTRFFVYRHYVDVLHRAPEQGGWDDWTNYINGCPPDANYNQCIVDRHVSAARGFFESAESKNNNPGLAVQGEFGTPERHSYNDEYVEQLYITYLGRRSDPGGKQDWLNFIDSSGDYNSLVHGFLYSTEYRSKFGRP